MKLKYIIVSICILCLSLTFLLADWYRHAYFVYGSEAYMKGEGHLLQEDLWKAMFYITVLQFCISLFLTVGILVVMPEKHHKDRRTLCIIAGTIIIFWLVVYLIYQFDNIVYGYVATERILEITMTWLLRVAGIIAGYGLTQRIMKRFS